MRFWPANAGLPDTSYSPPFLNQCIDRKTDNPVSGHIPRVRVIDDEAVNSEYLQWIDLFCCVLYEITCGSPNTDSPRIFDSPCAGNSMSNGPVIYGWSGMARSVTGIRPYAPISRPVLGQIRTLGRVLNFSVPSVYETMGANAPQ